MSNILIKNLINTLFFNIRNKLAFSRPIKRLPNENKELIFSDQTIKNKAQNILEAYNLTDIYNNSSKLHYKEILYTIKLLEDVFENTEILAELNQATILDIGSKNFSYANALHSFFSYYKTNTKRDVYLDGIEIDPFRIMADFHSRYDYAMYYIKNLPNTNYLTGDFLELACKNYDVITWFLPFLITEPLIRWGLPVKYLKPEIMFQKAYDLLNPKGVMLVVNQFEKEKNIQLKMITGLGLNYIEIKKPYTNIFSPYQLERYIILIRKD